MATTVLSVLRRACRIDASAAAQEVLLPGWTEGGRGDAPAEVLVLDASNTVTVYPGGTDGDTAYAVTVASAASQVLGAAGLWRFLPVQTGGAGNWVMVAPDGTLTV